jgi:ribosome biogenesis GTPase A
MHACIIAPLRAAQLHALLSRTEDIGDIDGLLWHLLQVLLLLKLRLLADVVLVGLPNVGKSSLIAALTHARAQVNRVPRVLVCCACPVMLRLPHLTLGYGGITVDTGM